MTKQTISIFMITLFFLSAYGSLSNAEEIVLCVNSTDQYVVAVEKDGDCLEGENQMKMTGSDMADKKSLTPVAAFEDYVECETEGTVTKIGFDKNNNYKLDEDELMNTSSTCAVNEDQSEE